MSINICYGSEKENLYFAYANYPYLFKMLSDKDKIDYDTIDTDRKKYIAACLSYDGDDLFYLYENLLTHKIYLSNGNGIINSDERLKYDIQVSNTIEELLCNNYNSELIDIRDSAYNMYIELSYNQYLENIDNANIPKGVFPKVDLRLFLKDNYPNILLIDHKEINTSQLELFFKRTGLDKFVDVHEFCKYQPIKEDYLKVIGEANKVLIDSKFYYIKLYPSDYHAILYSKDITTEELCIFIQYGLIYNKIDIPEEIYNKLR